MGTTLHGARAAVKRYRQSAIFVAIAIGVFVLDRILKIIVVDQMQVGDRHVLIDPVLELRYVQNPGIAFGLLAGHGPIVLGASLIVGILMVIVLLRIEGNDRWTLFGGALITGGAFGNLVDRIQQSYVVDYIHLPNWPTFNAADIAIVSGVVCVLVGQLLQGMKHADHH
jgi:signal peptidase II